VPVDENAASFDCETLTVAELLFAGPARPTSISAAAIKRAARPTN